jgi:AcrR family transcriptional regulator
MTTADRRQAILVAAFDCFIQYGHAKTTFDDVAKKAEVSRSLLYTYFKDKEDLFLSVARQVLDEQRRKTEAVIESGSGAEQEFRDILELWGLELYAKVSDSAHGRELLGEGYRVWDQIGRKYHDYLVRLLSGFVGGADAAEVVVLSIRGLQWDHPSMAVLRKRIRVLEGLVLKHKRRP